MVGNEILISEAYQLGSSLLAVRPGGYDVIWHDARNQREKTLKTHWNTPICVDGYLYGCSGRHASDADLRCVEWRTGKVRWAEGQPLAQRSSLLYVDGYFVCLGERGTLQLIRVNPDRYDLVSEVVLRTDGQGQDPFDQGPARLLKHPCWAAPILAHGLLFVRGADRVVCLEVIPDRD